MRTTCIHFYDNSELTFVCQFDTRCMFIEVDSTEESKHSNIDVLPFKIEKAAKDICHLT